MRGAGTPWQIVADGVVLVVRLTPRGGRDAIEAVERLADGRFVLKARVRAAASEGRTVFASITQPSGVQGTSAGSPIASRPALSG